MILAATIEMYCYGTSEGVEKAWDTRGRGRVDFSKMLFHHGSPVPYDVKSMKGPAYFTNDKDVAEHYSKGPIKGKIFSGYLDLKNPKIEKSAPMRLLWNDISSAQKAGHDAIVQDVGEGRYDVVVFEPTKTFKEK